MGRTRLGPFSPVGGPMMKHFLRLTEHAGESEADQGNNASERGTTTLSFLEAQQDESLLPFPMRSGEQIDGVLRSLDRLSTTLDELRQEVDSMEDPDGPDSAA